MNNRHTLTKSLHTVTAVSRLAASYLSATSGYQPRDVDAAVRGALLVLGQRGDWNAADPTFAACVAAVAKVRS